MLFIPILLLYCCNINLKFKEEDLKWIEVYQLQDQLVFKSSLKYDTITISKIKIGNGKSDLMESSYNEIYGNIYYKQLNSEKEEFIISLGRLYPQQPTSATFNFKGDYGRINDIHNYSKSELIFNGEKRKGYMFKPYSKDKPSFWWDEEYGVENANLKYFFWDIEYGIIQYETVEGEVFVLEEFIQDGKNILKF